MRPGPIPALAAARRAVRPRRDVWLDGHRVGSVAEPHLPLLAAHDRDFAIGPTRVEIRIAPAQRAQRLAELHRAWHAQGAIVGWRDETYGLWPLDDAVAAQPRENGSDAHPPGAGSAAQPLVPIERAASRFWGSLTFGAHANGFVRGATGRPVALWIAQRSAHKPTDPGLFDNLIGGGVPLGQSPAEALVREAWEEAGLAPGLARGATPGRDWVVTRDLPEGLQRERLFTFDLELPAGLTPANQDGEVQGFQLLPWGEALALALGLSMTVDAALTTLDFGDRHGLLPDSVAADWRSFLSSQN